MQVQGVQNIPQKHINGTRGNKSMPKQSSYLCGKRQKRDSAMFISLRTRNMPQGPVATRRFFVVASGPSVFSEVVSLGVFG